MDSNAIDVQFTGQISQFIFDVQWNPKELGSNISEVMTQQWDK